jgi:5-methylcytosine-specific restriction endonuclease McrA
LNNSEDVHRIEGKTIRKMSDSFGDWEKEIIPLCEILGITVSEAICDLKTSLEQRISLLMKVEPGLSREFVKRYLVKLLLAEPDEEVIYSVHSPSQRIILNQNDRLILQTRQKNRCGLCGSRLYFNKNPHVDHIVPISRLGTNKITNLQLLCSRCNLGKGAHLGWPLAAPFYEDQISPKVRYFVLSRSKGNCQIPMCMNTSLNSELRINTKISRGEGGRNTLDNLIAICAKHDEERSISLLSKFKYRTTGSDLDEENNDQSSRFAATFRNLQEGEK